jgi:hypothetical protein
MKKRKIASTLDISQWQVSRLRVTAFPSPSAKIAEPKWWGELLGSEPDSRNLRPSMGEIIEQGPFDKGVLSLNVSPLRIDWKLEMVMDLQLEEASMPSLGSYPEVGDKFCKLMVEWLSLASVPAIQRLAFGAILQQPVNGREAGYRLLSRYLPAVDLTSESRDFLYQINRPRKSKVPSMTTYEINRLTKWGCASLQRGLIQHQGGVAKSSTLGEPTYACILELDISTPTEFKGELPQRVIAQVLREQYEFGKEIASSGDMA